jgi:hypothetical protein
MSREKWSTERDGSLVIDGIVVQSPSEFSEGLTKDRIARAVACVNACEGIEDPAEHKDDHPCVHCDGGGCAGCSFSGRCSGNEGKSPRSWCNNCDRIVPSESDLSQPMGYCAECEASEGRKS